VNHKHEFFLSVPVKEHKKIRLSMSGNQKHVQEGQTIIANVGTKVLLTKVNVGVGIETPRIPSLEQHLHRAKSRRAQLVGLEFLSLPEPIAPTKPGG
jgi:pyruvate formate-lyase activating enzyme-like uncharacterized protein